jgi:broad specificity phosphatase PhoE
MLYIRHSEKLYKNGQNTEYSLDPGLTDNGKLNVMIKFTELLKYGIPSVIYCSPYLRTRETAIIAQYVVKNNTNTNVEIIVDSLLSEYLGHQKNVNFEKDVHKETLQYNPITTETWKEYTNRIKQHIKINNQLQIDNKIIWYITHGIVIQSISFIYGNKIKYPSTLGGFIKINDNIEVIN